MPPSGRTLNPASEEKGSCVCDLSVWNAVRSVVIRPCRPRIPTTVGGGGGTEPFLRRARQNRCCVFSEFAVGDGGSIPGYIFFLVFRARPCTPPVPSGARQGEEKARLHP